MREPIIQTMVNKFLTWLSKKSVTALYKQTHFWAFSWGLDEHTDLYLFSEESYHDRHRFGLHEETYERKTESNSEKTNNCEHITEDGVTCAKYPACDDCLDNPLNKLKGSERLVKGKDEPQTDYGDFADRLAYERGVKHAWEVAQKVFCSTVTFYEAEDVAKQITKDEPQTDCPWK